MKRILGLILAAVLVLSLAACGNDAEEADNGDGDAGAEVEEIDFSVALVTDLGGIDDKSFNQGTWEGVLRFAEDTGAQTDYKQSNSDADYIPNLSTFAEEEHDLIVAPGFLFAEAMAKSAETFPDQNFLIIDSVVGGYENVASAVFAEEHGSFLVGVAAAKAAQDAGKDTVGFIGGGDFDLIWKFEAGYEAGVHAVDPNMTVLVDYVGDFADSGKGQSLASKQYDNGAYVIYHAAGGAGNGLIKEAKDRRTNGEDVWAIGVDKDQYADGIYEGEKSAILTSMIKRVDVAAYNVAQATLDGEFPGGEVIAFNLENGGVGIPEENPNLSDEIVTLVKEYEEKVKSGELEVPVTPSRLQ